MNSKIAWASSFSIVIVALAASTALVLWTQDDPGEHDTLLPSRGTAIPSLIEKHSGETRFAEYWVGPNDKREGPINLTLYAQNLTDSLPHLINTTHVAFTCPRSNFTATTNRQLLSPDGTHQLDVTITPNALRPGGTPEYCEARLHTEPQNYTTRFGVAKDLSASPATYQVWPAYQ